ncbi:MAG: glycerol-3-phosphate 1-O-acyltransferase PlsY, partial [Deltaproteobacteria bacterium]|nr:glycerol-3-phosphate 1-O-acyltransferase PlsY [Deltaproteobacteria bacterium]
MATIWIGIAYLIGSIPFGLVLAKTFCRIDPRTEGSGNIGSTNVARLCGKGWGVATLACDILKGTLAVAMALYLSDSSSLHSLTALAAILGHLHSCFLGFKGGKAVATSIGVLIPLAFVPLLLASLLCVVVIWRSGFVSLGSLTLVTALPLLLMPALR